MASDTEDSKTTPVGSLGDFRSEESLASDGDEIAMSNVMTAIRKLSACLLLTCLCGCGSEPETRGVRVKVDGIVTIDGEPLPAGRIVYITDQGAGKVKATAAIVNGFYSFPEGSGPLAGKARIEIYPQEMELEEFEAERSGPSDVVDFVRVQIPAKYNVNSELERDVQPDADSNLFSFELESQ